MKFKIIYLKSFIFGIIIFTIIISIFVIPSLIREGMEFYSKIPIIIFFSGIYLTIIPFIYSNIQVIKIFGYVNNNEFYSEKTVQSLNKIKKSFFVIGIIYTLLMPMFYYLGEIDDAPGLILVGLIIVLSTFFVYILNSIFIELIKIKISK
ncbi:DUF2975 domain-containing protein [Marinitoga sp. 38H-ov]|uniref:DUF2975 domain-containing protein n=1 Tax=Marinitoga sp. 38H-ov TaxID=1755814 RepID=UPI0016B2019D|nr:DUF2975 domain-containing protein [Marinitoga sp. 38H-ov]KAF2956848.1 hypothetical protein AS160_03610 [Marinitoga sp. 38H-ov]